MTGQQYCLFSNQTAINTSAVAAGGQNFPTQNWSSTELSTNFAFSIRFTDGMTLDIGKTAGRRMRCTRSITP